MGEFRTLFYTNSHAISLNFQSWVRVAMGKKHMPSARRDHATILLRTEENPQLFMTGGIDRNWRSLGDAWILNLEREAERRINRGSWFKVQLLSLKLR